MTVVETSRLTLRPVEAGDLDAFAPFLADPDVVRFIGGETLTRDRASDRVALWRARFARDGFGQFSVLRREDGCIVGRCGLLVWALPSWEITTRADAVGDYEIEVGWMLGREHWGNGYATEAASAVRDFAFGSLGLDRLISLIAEDNTASAAVAKRLGMAIEGEARWDEMRMKIWALAP